MGNAGAALGIIGIIIGAGAIGFAFFVWNGQNTTNSDLDDLTDQVNSMTGPSNTTDPTDLTAEFNNLTAEFNDLAAEFNDLESVFNNLTQIIVVGIWDGLSDNIDYTPHNSQDDWLFEFGDNNLSNTDYISVSNTNTRITLLKSGWYRIHLSVLLRFLDPNMQYYIILMKDGVSESFILYYDAPSIVFSYYHVDSSVFVYSDGTNYIEINGVSYTDNSFSMTDVDPYNQLTIEYVNV